MKKELTKQKQTKKTPEFSDILLEVRSQLELTQKHMAEKLNLSFATINRWEQKKTIPSKLMQQNFFRFCALMVQERKIKLSKSMLVVMSKT